MYETVKMENMTWEEYALKKDRVLILPIGSMEQHGPHLPLGVDTIIAKELAYRLAVEIDGIVAATIPYGYKSKPLSGGGPLFPGTIDLNGSTLQQLVIDLLDEFVKDGFTKIFILSAHFENEAYILDAMDFASAKYGSSVTLVLSNWWDPLSQETIDRIFSEVPFPGWAFEHAAITETSLIMYFAPKLVREERIVETQGASPCSYFKYPIDKDIIPKSGVLASARSSSAEKGKLIVDEVIANFINIVNTVF